MLYELSNIYSPNRYGRDRLNQIMLNPEGRGHDADSEVMICQSIPTIAVWRVNIA